MKIIRSKYHLSYYHILIYIISQLWSGTDSEALPGYSINVPHHVTVQRGLCVFIPCSFTVPETERLTINAKGIWYNKDDEPVTSRSYTWYENNERFFLVGDLWSGDCSLYIEDPIYEDEGRYCFRFEDNKKITYQDIQPYVEVTDLTIKPEISPIKSWIDGEKVTLSCTFPGTCGRGTPKITWRGNIQNGIVENQVKIHEDGTKTHFSTITFTARKEQNNSPLSCIVQLKRGLTTVQQITMKVESSMCMDNQIIIGIVIGNIFILLLLGLGVFCFNKRHVEKKKHRTESNDFQLHDAKGTESVYQDLNRPSDSIYHSIQSAQQ